MPQKNNSQQKARAKNESWRLWQLTAFERTARKKGFMRIAGVDEAGRGPLAGPVVAAACMLGAKIRFKGINDSKALSPLKRRALFKTITNHPQVEFGLGIIDEKRVDEINIYQATLEAMQLAIEAIKEPPDYVLIDGGCKLEIKGMEVVTVIRGDQRSQSIAAASIIAKVTRDAIMCDYHTQYPEYGFDVHKGYGTACHLAALKKHGPCPIHRRSFAPVAHYEVAYVS